MSETPAPAPALTTRGELTRARILDAALALFRERGYEETTMRAVAERADVALGNAYYYFRSKDHLIQGFYARSHEEHLAACLPFLARERDLAARLRDVLRAKLETSAPYHRFAGVLFRTAADPGSPLNPFSADSAATREQAIALFAAVVDGSTTKVPPDLRAELPYLLWLFEMGVILYWIHDTSPAQRRSYRLVELSVPIVVRLIALGANPVLRPVRRSVLRLVAELRAGAGGGSGDDAGDPAPEPDRTPVAGASPDEGEAEP